MYLNKPFMWYLFQSFFKEEVQTLAGASLAKCSVSLLFMVIYGFKRRVFGFCGHPGLCETLMTIFHNLLTFLTIC